MTRQIDRSESSTLDHTALRARVIAIGVVAALAFIPRLASADCESQCTESSSCSKLCYQDGEKMTCGAWGVCHVVPPCTPNWQQVSSSPAGFVFYNDYPINQCNEFAATKIVERDLNQCNPNNLERHYCTFAVYHLAIGCCGQGCYPQTFDYTSCN